MRRYLTYLLFFLCSAASARGSELNQAFDLLHQHKNRQAVTIALRLIDTLKLNTIETIVKAYVILGVGHCHLGEEAHALDHFDTLKKFDPLATLDSVQVSNRCLAIFETMSIPKKISFDPSPYIKAEMVSPDSPTRRLGLDGASSRYIPFGVGQFKNNQRKKGVAFILAQSLLYAGGLTMLGINVAQEHKIIKDSGHAMLGAGGFVSLWGIVDAVHVYKNPNDF